MASTIVLAGRIDISVEKAGEDTVAAQIELIFNQTVDFKSSVQLRTEELGNKYAGSARVLTDGPYDKYLTNG